MRGRRPRPRLRDYNMRNSVLSLYDILPDVDSIDELRHQIATDVTLVIDPGATVLSFAAIPEDSDRVKKSTSSLA